MFIVWLEADCSLHVQRQRQPYKKLFIGICKLVELIWKLSHISEEHSDAAAHLDSWHRGRDTDSASKISSTQWPQSPAQSELQSYQVNTGSAVSGRAVPTRACELRWNSPPCKPHGPHCASFSLNKMTSYGHTAA